VDEGTEYEGTARVTLRAVVIGLLTPAVATVIAYPVAPTRPAISIAVFMLAVVIAAVAGGLWGGLIAAIIASTVRPLVVSEPQLSFRLDDVEDIATAVVFLSVALVVGLLVGQASEDRARGGA
jgi:K+-sensing histidine kinase KdpD